MSLRQLIRLLKPIKEGKRKEEPLLQVILRMF